VAAEKFEEVLKAGMVIMAEPNPITADGMFGIFLGHTFIVTDNGHEVVDDFPLEIAVAGEFKQLPSPGARSARWGGVRDGGTLTPPTQPLTLFAATLPTALRGKESHRGIKNLKSQPSSAPRICSANNLA